MRPETVLRSADVWSRRGVTSLMIGVLMAADWPLDAAGAYEVPGKTDRQLLEQRLYQMQPNVVPYQQQVSDAITIQSMKGVWALQESFRTAKVAGTLTFQGAVGEEKGTVAYDGDAARGRGPWIIKADGFGRSPRGVGGAIERKALWSVPLPASSTCFDLVPSSRHT